MPVTGPKAFPDRQNYVSSLGSESEFGALEIGAYNFPTTDSRDNVGFLGSLPLSPQTKSKPVTPRRVVAAAPACDRSSVAPPGPSFIPVPVRPASWRTAGR